jgi:hypothetical protein
MHHPTRIDNRSVRHMLTILALCALALLGQACGSPSGQAPAPGASGQTGASAAAGAPPAGFTLAMATPADQADRFGTEVALALGANDDPIIAYIWSDPNADSQPNDTTLNVIAWDRANARWGAPVTVVKGGELHGATLAHDADTNTFGLAYAVGSFEIGLARSTDGGRTWVTEQVQKDDGSVGPPALALVNGTTYLAFYHGNDGIRYLTRAAASGPFSASVAPVLPNSQDPRIIQPALAFDRDRHPALAYLLNRDEGYNLDVAFWRPGEPAAHKVMDTNDHQTDAPGLSLAFAGDQFGVAFYAARDDTFFQTKGASVWFSRSADGANWSEPQSVPPDEGVTFSAPLLLALDTQGHGAIAIDTNGGDGTTNCGWPKVARSADLKSWKTCSPDQTGELKLSPAHLNMMFNSTGKLVMAFLNTNNESPIKPGLVFLREP